MSTHPIYQLYDTREQKAELEARNGLLLFCAIEEMAQDAWKSQFTMTPETLCELHRLVIKDLYTCAGRFRVQNLRITNTPHQPPAWETVIGHVNEMCAYINDRFASASPLHLAAYAMWRHNWIHPFLGGNGRTSRGISYLILLAKMGFLLPGEETIPQQIVANRGPYYDALKAADAAALEGRVDVSAMEDLLSGLLATQLLSVHNKASGK